MFLTAVIDAGAPAVAVLMAPSVTPWFSTLPGFGSNNPGVRLYKYSRQTRCIVDYVQYFLNLTAANAAVRDIWSVEYRATEAYGISAINATSLGQVLQQFVENPSLFNRYYRYNSVSYDLTACTGRCRKEQVCAAAEVEFDKYAQCLWFQYPASTSTTTHKPHRHHRHRMQMFTYFLLGGLIFVIAVLFLLLAVFCCQRRHAIIYFSRSHYSLIRDS